MTIVFLIVIAICLLGLAFIVGELYGLDNEPNFWAWVKEQHKMAKDASAELKAERAFLKANPLCVRCSREKRYRKAKHMWTRQDTPEALCDECYKKAEEDYFCGWA